MINTRIKEKKLFLSALACGMIRHEKCFSKIWNYWNIKF